MSDGEWRKGAVLPACYASYLINNEFHIVRCRFRLCHVSMSVECSRTYRMGGWIRFDSYSLIDGYDYETFSTFLNVHFDIRRFSQEEEFEI